ncbi:MAG TPA: peptidoglycan-binding protein [Thermoanaerobaculia bacterium]|jgi:peptidoglycan hydrolase-like protein with peptidoglycan-binding domain|nr:peptidoglycan-binding protein [Thermoanaerobaculia bacterium]
MVRVFFAKGVQGEIVRRLQLRLTELGFDTRGIDGVFGQDTVKAVQAFQADRKLGVTGEVDGETYQKLIGQPVPPVRDRALGLTGHFEGHGFTLAQGNFDGAGITWGIIGFTLSGGKLKQILLEIKPELVRQAFGTKTDQLLGVLKLSMKQQIAFADSISLGASKARLAEPWRSAFRTLGEFPEVQEIQLRHVDEGYFQPALQTAKDFGLKTELGTALAFDIHVQNGGIRTAAREQIRKEQAAHPLAAERDLRIIIAHAVADKTKNPKFRDDVRERKLTLASGSGRVHGEMFVLRDWGLDDL